MVRVGSREVSMKGSYKVVRVSIVLDPDKGVCQQDVLVEAML